VHYQPAHGKVGINAHEKENPDKREISTSLGMSPGLFHYDKSGSMFIGDKPLRLKLDDGTLRPTSTQAVEDEVVDDISSSRTVDPDMSDQIFTSTLKVEFVDYLVTQYFTSYKASEVSAPGGSGNPLQGGTESTPTYQQTRGSTSDARKKVLAANDDDDTQDNDPVFPSQDSPNGDYDGRLLAYPYYKWKPLTYKTCQGKVLKEISRLKLYL